MTLSTAASQPSAELPVADPAAARISPALHDLSPACALSYAGMAILAFHLADLVPFGAWLMLVFLWSLTQLTRVPSSRLAFYLPFAVGLCIYTPHLAFFYTIFHGFAFCLWMVLPFFLGMYVFLGRLARRNLPPPAAMAVLPVLWLGLEYFRCELWPLRFGWLTPALAFADIPPTGMLYYLGGFGLSALLVAAVAPLTFLHLRPLKPWLIRATATAASFALIALLPAPTDPVSHPQSDALSLTGVQTETMTDDETLAALNAACAAHPDTDLFVLSEYAFTGRVPDAFLAWCREHKTHLIAGGSDLISQSPRKKYNTAFVVGPDGTILFQQAKSVPIQFFDDGLAAPSQEVWPAPFAAADRIAMCVCYDLSFTRIIDAFAQKEALLMVVPTMDVAQWGDHQHWLHSRVAPIRAAEYGLPIFRLCSSGISQAVNAHGEVYATAPCPGRGAILHANLEASTTPGHLPLDRYLAPVAVALIPLFVLWLSVIELHRRWRQWKTASQG